MRIGVTGASGHLGNVLVRTLLARGYGVRALYHQDRAPLLGLHAECIQGDILDRAALERFVQGCDVVIHCAAVISIDGDPDGKVMATNRTGVSSVLEACSKSRVRRVIHVSSTHAVEEHPHGTPCTEDRPYKGGKSDVYDRSKAEGEQLILDAIASGAIHGCIVRPSAMIGPFDFKPSSLGMALFDLRDGKVPFLVPGGYDMVDVRDVVDAMVSAIENGRNGEVYNLSGGYHTVRDLALIVSEITGQAPPGITLPYGLLRALLPFIRAYGKVTGQAPLFTKSSIDTLRNGHPNIDSSKARTELGSTKRPLIDTIRALYAWQAERTIDPTSTTDR